LYGEPLIIETTADRKSNFEKRVTTLRSLGYDVGIVYTHTTKEISFSAEKERRNQESRTVDTETMERMWADMPTRLAEISSFMGKGNFLYIPRKQMDFTDDQRVKLQDFTRNFMTSPPSNPKGQSMRDKLQQTPHHTIITLTDDNVHDLYMLLSSWFDK
jgi:hypothetical protein